MSHDFEYVIKLKMYIIINAKTQLHTRMQRINHRPMLMPAIKAQNRSKSNTFLPKMISMLIFFFALLVLNPHFNTFSFLYPATKLA